MFSIFFLLFRILQLVWIIPEIVHRKSIFEIITYTTSELPNWIVFITFISLVSAVVGLSGFETKFDPTSGFFYHLFH